MIRLRACREPIVLICQRQSTLHLVRKTMLQRSTQLTHCVPQGQGVYSTVSGVRVLVLRAAANEMVRTLQHARPGPARARKAGARTQDRVSARKTGRSGGAQRWCAAA